MSQKLRKKSSSYIAYIYLILLLYFYIHSKINFLPKILKAYFSPLFFPNLTEKIEYFKEFKEYYDNKYKISKGEKIIWIEFSLFLILFGLLILSFYKVSSTNPRDIPNNEIWKINFPEELSQNHKTEYLTLLFERREEILLANKGFISKNATESSDISDYSKILF